ncbi:MAG TPA: porin [Armatimonadota bacterium]
MNRRTLAAIIAASSALLLMTGLAQADLTWSGYSQFRFNQLDEALNQPNNRDFNLRRARLQVAGPINDQGTEMALQIDLAKLDDRQDDTDPRNRRVVLKDAWLKHPLTPEVAARMGFTSVPFGYETPGSDSAALCFEHSKAGLSFFPEEREEGLYLLAAPKAKGMPQVALGYSNGLYAWGDKDAKTGDQDTKDHAWEGRVQWMLPRNGVAGVSYQTADRTRSVGGITKHFDQNVLGVHARWICPNNLVLAGEYYTGEILDVGSKGYYLLAEYRPGPKRAMPFYRYDQFDDGIAGHQLYQRNTLGVGWDIAKNERITVQGERYDDVKSGTFTNIGVQWQIMYGGK